VAISYIGNIPNAHIRDHQRKRLYEAEEECSFWNNITVLSINNIKHLVGSISEWAEIKPPTIILEGHIYVYATQDAIVLPYTGTQTLPFICHEMSHVINYNSTDADHHGRNFASTYLKVVRQFIGLKSYRELLASFRKHKVKYRRRKIEIKIPKVMEMKNGRKAFNSVSTEDQSCKVCRILSNNDVAEIEKQIA